MSRTDGVDELVCLLREWLDAEEEMNHRRSRIQSPESTALLQQHLFRRHSSSSLSSTPFETSTCFRKLIGATASGEATLTETVEVLYRRSLMSRLTRLDNLALLEAGQAWIRFAPKHLLCRTLFSLVDASLGALEDAHRLRPPRSAEESTRKETDYQDDDESEVMFEIFVHRVFEIIDGLLSLEPSSLPDVETREELPRRLALLFYKFRKFVVDERGNHVRRTKADEDVICRTFFAALGVMTKHAPSFQFDCRDVLRFATSEYPPSRWTSNTRSSCVRFFVQLCGKPEHAEICREIFALQRDRKSEFRSGLLLSLTDDVASIESLVEAWLSLMGEEEEPAMEVFCEILKFAPNVAMNYVASAVETKRHRARLLILATLNPAYAASGLWTGEDDEKVRIELFDYCVDAFERDPELIRFYAPLALSAIEFFLFSKRTRVDLASRIVWLVGEHCSETEAVLELGMDVLERASRYDGGDEYLRSLQGAALKFGTRRPNECQARCLRLLTRELRAEGTFVGRLALSALQGTLS